MLETVNWYMSNQRQPKTLHTLPSHFQFMSAHNNLNNRSEVDDQLGVKIQTTNLPATIAHQRRL
jgi:hypothetical protein